MWHFWDNYEPAFLWGDKEPIAIASERELIELLEHYGQQDPRIVVLSDDAGNRMVMGVGGPYGTVEFFAGPEAHMPLTATPKEAVCTEDVYFVNEGQPARALARHVMQFHEMVRVIVLIYRTGQLPPLVKWE
jgi:hypothetical protein